MKNIGIIVNNKKDPKFKNFRYVARIIKDSGFCPFVSSEYSSIFPESDYVKTTLEDMFKKCSMVIALGGLF